ALRLWPFRTIQPLAAVIADEIFHDSIFKRMKSDDGDTRSRFESGAQNAHALLERAQLVVHFHPQRLKCLRRGVSASMTADDSFDRARELECFGKGRIFTHLHYQTGDAARGRFFTKVAEQTSQIFFAIAVYNIRGR